LRQILPQESGLELPCRRAPGVCARRWPAVMGQSSESVPSIACTLRARSNSKPKNSGPSTTGSENSPKPRASSAVEAATVSARFLAEAVRYSIVLAAVLLAGLYWKTAKEPKLSRMGSVAAYCGSAYLSLLAIVILLRGITLASAVDVSSITAVVLFVVAYCAGTKRLGASTEYAFAYGFAFFGSCAGNGCGRWDPLVGSSSPERCGHSPGSAFLRLYFGEHRTGSKVMSSCAVPLLPGCAVAL